MSTCHDLYRLVCRAFPSDFLGCSYGYPSPKPFVQLDPLLGIVTLEINSIEQQRLRRKGWMSKWILSTVRCLAVPDFAFKSD